MQIIYYPDEKSVTTAITEKEPLLMLISFDGKTVILSHIDEAVEHHILLMKAGFSDKDIDKHFSLVIDDENADWTFVCPTDYKNITDKSRRIKQFYKDGFATISQTLSELGLMLSINIPRRYRRHFDFMIEN